MRQESTQDEPGAVLVGADSYVGLQSARILAKRGISVTAVASDPKSAYCRSRSVARVVKGGPTPDSIAVLEALGTTFANRPVLIPCSDEWVLVASRHRRRLKPYYEMVLPDPDALERFMDKGLFYTFAERHGFPVVPFEIVSTRADAERAAERLRFPAIVKPTHRSGAWVRCAGQKAVRVETPEAFLALHSRCGDAVPELVVQEWIPGGDEALVACNLYVDRTGEVLVTFVTSKIRQYPPLTGQASLAVEARDDEVLDLALRIFAAAGLRGIGSLELKRDAINGRLFITEANVGRPTGRSPITEAAGVEFLYTAFCDTAALPLPSNRVQQYGDTKWIYLTRDIFSAVHYYRAGELTLGGWWRSLRGRKQYAVFSWSDPLPFILDIPQTALRAGRVARSAARVRRTRPG